MSILLKLRNFMKLIFKLKADVWAGSIFNLGSPEKFG